MVDARLLHPRQNLRLTIQRIAKGEYVRKIALLCSAAAAAAFVPATPAAAQITSGGRVEVRGGWERIHSSASLAGSPAVSGHIDGADFGAELGYDYVAGSSFLVGAYGGAELSTGKTCRPVFGGDSGCIKAGRNFTAGIRAGVPAGHGVLIYAKGGYSNGQLKASYRDGNPADSFDGSSNRSGWHIGAGVEAKLTRNAYAKVEYVYTRYNGYHYDLLATHLSADAERHQLLLAFGFHF
ncbi:MAG TPA: outer membrane beta-barrel protein [Allosphingosinicella sp.]|nr:outer membrane beta-barrel protein [Allosphingosinicella sp.]